MNTPNNNFFPWDDIQEDNVFPAGCFRMEITNLEDGYSQNTGKRMFKAQFTCKAPAEFQGMSHFENYVTGTDEDLTGIVAGTMGARGLKRLLKAAQVPQGNEIEHLCISAKGAELMLTLNVFEEKEGPFAGEKRNRISSYDRIGTKEAGLAPGVRGRAQGVSAPPNLPPSPAQSPQTAPVASVSQVAPQAPAAPVAPQAQPTAQPPVQQPVVAPAPQASPAPPATPAANPSDPVVTCTICNAQVPSSQLGAHVAAHAQQG